MTNATVFNYLIVLDIPSNLPLNPSKHVESGAKVHGQSVSLYTTVVYRDAFCRTQCVFLPIEDVQKAQQIQSLLSSELWTISNPRGGTNRKNLFYSSWNLFKLAFTAFGDPTCGVTELHFMSSRWTVGIYFLHITRVHNTR
ncbi:hypothetical protein AVEN_271023-1 [Araneus ventricosus]|uniref:Uncharacterized protein n=1 Tax=Araneus ventricosus TaxID=182803 RepID=A0A4Y2M211_ARAVE|nr:hypothetical protein AVEN_271023-1 [Araneus ventricosus]